MASNLLPVSKRLSHEISRIDLQIAELNAKRKAMWEAQHIAETYEAEIARETERVAVGKEPSPPKYPERAPTSSVRDTLPAKEKPDPLRNVEETSEDERPVVVGYKAPS